MEITRPSWEIKGILTEKRKLGTKADKNAYWCVMGKIAGVGESIEAQSRNVDLLDHLAEGENVHATGHFEAGQGGSLKAVLSSIVVIKAGGGKAA